MYSLISQPNTTCSSMVYFSSFADTVNENGGTYKFVSLAGKIAKLVIKLLEYLGKTLYIPELKNAIKVFGATCKGLVLNKTVASAVAFKKTFNLAKPSEKMLYNSLELAGDMLTISGYFGAIRIAKASKITSLTNTIIDTKNHLGKIVKNDSVAINNFKFKCSINKYFRVLTLGLVEHPLVSEENPEELRKIAILKVAKDVMSLFTSIIAVAALVTSTMLVSEFALLIISTIAIILSLSTKVLEDTTSHKAVLLNISK